MNISIQLRSLLFLSFCLLATCGNSQNSPDEIVTKFFSLYEKEGSSKALDYLYSNNKWMLRIEDAIVKIKTSVEGLNEDYVGKYYGYEAIVSKQLSESYVLKSYLVKYDRQPFRFTFQFYKPKDNWVTYSFQMDSNLDDEIEESAKMYYLNLNH